MLRRFADAPPGLRVLAMMRRPDRTVMWQVAVVAAVSAIMAIVAIQTAANLKSRGIASGFGYLHRPAGFEIAGGLVSFSSRDTYARALEVGLVNTLRVASLGIFFATALGFAIGAARLSPVWIVTASSRVYVEVLRNTPLLLQLLVWYSLAHSLPSPQEALHLLPGVMLSDRGLFLPCLAWHAGFPWLAIDRPELVRFGFRGGTSVSPEFASLLIGLSTYTAAFIGEIVRGGILSVGRGQTEAAASLGLSRLRTLRLVVLPQALPVIVPPTTVQFLSLVKNSSLAVAIGYPELIAITTTTLNQTGQAVEAIALGMSLYVAISLAISLSVSLWAARTPSTAEPSR